MRKKTVSIIVINKGKYLAVSRKYDLTKFSLAGGKVEEGETPFDACLRELEEETGLKAFPQYTELLDVRDYTNTSEGEPIEEEVYAYRVYQVYGDILPDEELLAKGEGIVRWVTKEELLKGAFGDYNVALLNDLGL